MRISRVLPVFSLLVVMALLASCAEERAPINRVQPFALDKALFVGTDLSDPGDNPEFWTQATLVDVGFGATHESLFTSTYAQPLTRIKWHITEDLLIGRLAYERIDGTDGKGVGKKTDEGNIVLAFTIDKHFDIVYDYNTTTGEKINVLDENDTDRPWYERQYMRVDFSRNLQTDAYSLDTLSMLGIYDGIVYEPLAYYIDDPKHPDAPVFDLENGYFDITTKAFAKPQMVDLSSWGWGIEEWPACWFEYDFLSGTWPSGDCNPSELTIRHSFRAVEDLDFEPVEWDGERFQAYGGFYIERLGYNRNYGMSDAHWHRFLTHYQIWERSHYYANPETLQGPVECFTSEGTPFGADPKRDEDHNGTHDECEAVGGGSRCDTFRQQCTLPYRQRTPLTIPWYYAEDSDPEFFDGSHNATHQWDVALRHSVVAARYVECRRTGSADCEKDYPVYFGQDKDHSDAIWLAGEVDDCRNSVAYLDKNKDPEQCAALADELAVRINASPGVVALAKMDEILVLCHSPVLAGDPPACGSRRLLEGMTQADCDALDNSALDSNDEEVVARAQACKDVLRARRGDLRYHQITVIEEPQSAMPWGIYVDSEDPLTGMKVATSVNVWSAVTDVWAQKVVDQLRYIAGELSTEDITEGKYVDDWGQAVEAAARGGMFPKMTREERDHRLHDFTGKNKAPKKAAAAWKMAQKHPEKWANARKMVEDFHGVKAWSKAGSTWAPLYAARRQGAQGTAVEAKLMNRMIQELFGVDSASLGEGLMNLISPLRAGNASLRREYRRMKQQALARRGVCVLEATHAPMDLVSISEILQEKFGAFSRDDTPQAQMERAEKMRSYVARRVHTGAVVHEMGHSIGQRHNFVSSADAWNYRPQYWQLRTKNGTVAEVCDELSPDGEECVGPRYFDPLTQEERDNLLQMFMHSSVMDYPGETTQDMMDLGPYDFASARIFYGDTIAVHADESYNIGTPRAATVLDKADDFGGILGITHVYEDEDIHYSQLQELFDLVGDCESVNPEDFKPARYDEESEGKWHPVLDGRIVAVDGQYSRCRNQPVDYVAWDDLRSPTPAEYQGWNPAVHTIDPEGRTRVPYGFATDSWADLGNVSVYTNDNGADSYEIFNFIITTQEVNHIFDNYRRGRQEFSVRNAEERSLWRYNEKVRDGAKGLSLMRNVFLDYALEDGMDPEGFWASVAPDWFKDNIIASSLVFDHFTKMATRPQSGPHFRTPLDPVLRSSVDSIADPGATLVVIPNGATGKFGNVAAAGRPIENRYADDQGEYGFDMTVNAGSYYDKINTAMLLTESVDNFISDTRQDFVDARYRAVSVADLFPDGYRRFLGNMLTGDDMLKGQRIASADGITPLLDGSGMPKYGIGWTTWWGDEPQSCFPAAGTEICSVWGDHLLTLPEGQTYQGAVLDPEFGWEEQKFYIAWTLLYLPENEQQKWLDMLRIWELGKDSDPGFENRIEFHNPAGKVYIAKVFGTEEVFGQTVQKGISARVLEYANSLLVKGYETSDGPDLDGNGTPDWYVPVLSEDTGLPIVRYDPDIAAVEGEWVYPEGVDGCDAYDNSECKCSNNRACILLERYVEVPFFLRQVLDVYELMDPEPDGIWN